MKPKSLVTAGLLVFVAVSVGVLIAKEMSVRSPGSDSGSGSAIVSAESGPRVIAYYFHGQTRCVACKTIEAYARETIDAHFADAVRTGRLEVRTVNFDEPENEHFLNDYGLVSSSLVLVDPRDNGPASWKLLQDVWQLTDDKPAFVAFVKAELGEFLARDGD